MRLPSIFFLASICSQASALPTPNSPEDVSVAAVNSHVREIAPQNGFAGQQGGTTGGSKAASDNVFTVSNVHQLRTALQKAGDEPKIILVKGTIDATSGKPFKDFADQKTRGLVNVPSHTTIFGLGGAKFINTNLFLKDVENVIIRNLIIDAPVDVDPHYENGDGWNAEWDRITIENSHHIWADHLTMSDGSFTDDKYHDKNGELYTQHDGLLDIKRGSDFVTLSNNYFNHHDKTNLIGHSDSNGAQDSGKLKVTIHNCVYDTIEQRAPRVRFGKVHSYNNHFIGNAAKSAKNYRYQYSLGIGHEGSIISEGNLFNIDGLKSDCGIINTFKNDGTFSDKGSQVGSAAWDYTKCSHLSKPNWAVPYKYSLSDASSLSRLQVGEGKL